MKSMLNVFRKHWIRIWLVIAIMLSVAILTTYAAYTEVSSVKRVVSTIDAPDTLFSSNCMKSTIQLRRVDAKTYILTVCNYDQDKPLVHDETEIVYNLKAFLEVKEADGSYTEITSSNISDYSAYADKFARYSIAKVQDDENGDISSPVEYIFSGDDDKTINFVNERLNPNQSSVDKYRITIDESALSNAVGEIFVHVEAQRIGGQNTKIEARLYGQNADTEASTWSGRITDSNYTSVDYDFYNYLISGTGVGTVKLMWDPNKIEINKYFTGIFSTDVANYDVNSGISTITEAGANYGWKTLTLNVNSAERNRYELQLFKRGGSSFDKANIDNYISCGFAYNIEEGSGGEG